MSIENSFVGRGGFNSPIPIALQSGCPFGCFTMQIAVDIRNIGEIIESTERGAGERSGHYSKGHTLHPVQFSEITIVYSALAHTTKP